LGNNIAIPLNKTWQEINKQTTEISIKLYHLKILERDRNEIIKLLREIIALEIVEIKATQNKV
jgi:hypothetical protein